MSNKTRKKIKRFLLDFFMNENLTEVKKLFLRESEIRRILLRDLKTYATYGMSWQTDLKVTSKHEGPCK